MKTLNTFISEGKSFKYYYHVTLRTNAKKIKSKGLVPFQTSNWAKGDGQRYNDYAGVYAFEHPIDAWKWGFKMHWEFKKPISIVRLKKNKSWEKDPSGDITLQMGQGKALMSPKQIPSSDVVSIIDLTFEKPKDLSRDEWMKNIQTRLTKS